MSPKITSKILLILIVVLGIISTVFVTFFRQQSTTKQDADTEVKIESAQPIQATQQEIFPVEASIGLPVHMWIPRINIDAPLERVGLTKDGAVDIPKGPTSPAWYEYGPRPGEIGSAIIVGHFGWKDNIPAVFDDLNKLAVGDKVSVDDDQGVTHTFIVRRIRTYKEGSITPEVFISTDGVAHLNLITCSGVWDKKIKSYSTRLVVFTDEEIN